jgi:RNA polymerase sigma-70 factor (ECF subfamily)
VENRAGQAGPSEAQHDASVALLERLKRRDEDAVRELVRQHNQRLFRLARGILRDPAEAEDVVQETYVRAFAALETFRGESSLGTWLGRIAVNEALGRLRRTRPSVEWSEPAEEHLHASRLDAPPSSLAADPERTMLQGEIRGLLERAIDQLPDTFRAVFVARIVEGLSIEETADLFGLKPDTVKTRVHRARARLRADLARQMGGAMTSAFAFAGDRCDRLTEAVVRRWRKSDPGAGPSGPGNVSGPAASRS